jgi:putative transposase
MGVRVRLEPTTAQEQGLTCHAGAARWAYNWGLEIRRQAYEHGRQRENAITLHRLLNSLKPTVFPWLYEVSKCAPQEALRDLDRAYENWWRRLKEGKHGRATGKQSRAAGAPQFKSRVRDGVGGFRLTGVIRVEAVDGRAYIQLPRIGRVRLRESDRFPSGSLSQVTVRERAGHWYVSAQVPAAVRAHLGRRPRQAEPEGVDLGLSALATFADGTKIPATKSRRNAQRKLRRLEREKSRRQRGSRNRARTCARIARLHERVSNQRLDALHKLTTTLATTRSAIVIEDLNVRGMSQNHALALSVMDAGFGEFRRQLEYKCCWYGCGLEIAPRFYPSTQTCSACGLVKTGDERLGLSQRTFRCAGCGLVLDRDQNAARVLGRLYGTEHTLKVVEQVVAASCAETENACGAGSSGQARSLSPAKLPAQNPLLREGSKNQRRDVSLLPATA